MKRFSLTKLQSYGIMAGLIDSKCRINGVGADHLIHNDRKEALNQAAWRLNLCFHNKTCPRCNRMFTRRHLQVCFHLEPMNEGQTILDELLNERKYDEFNRIFDFFNDVLNR